jgi:iron-sulfur cluster repair protein YtfE (RIC family)
VDAVVASNPQDAAAVEAVRQHHAQMSGALAALAERLASAADTPSALVVRDELVHWAEHELVPHARAEEKAMYPLAHQDSRARLLVEAMLAEHELIVGLVARLAAAREQVHAAAEARALSVTFESHLAKENDQILPLLAAAPEVSLAGALQGMHELLGGHDGDGGGTVDNPA